VILIYIPASLPAASAQKAVRLQSFLKNAGHKVSVVQGADRLGEALNSKPCDLVLSTLAEAAGLQTLLDAAPSKPAVLPVIHKETKPEVATAQRLYKYVVKDASSGEDYLDRIDEVLRSRQHSSSHKA
jgi:DNA-binding NtrC family response regulator